MEIEIKQEIEIKIAEDKTLTSNNVEKMIDKWMVNFKFI